MNNKFLNILRNFKIFQQLNSGRRINLNGKVFEIPHPGRMDLPKFRNSEPWMIDLLKMVLPKEEGLFLDVGANIGQTLLKVKSISEDIQYVGFEPNPECVFYLKHLIKINKFQNCRLFPIGISNVNQLAELYFFSDSETDSRASVIKDFREHNSVLKTDIVPLFSFQSIQNIIDLRKVSILKIDVEGGELEILESFFKVGDLSPLIIMEILPAYNKENTQRIARQEKIKAMLNKMEYSFFRIIKQSGNLINIEEIQEFAIHSDLNLCEYIMVPDGRKQEFLSLMRPF